MRISDGVQTCALPICRHNIQLMLGFNRRFDANFMKLKALVDAGEIGDVQLVKITSRDPAPPSVDYLKSSGGLFLRSEERRVGKECVSTCRSRWSPYH